jgi:RNA polymerase-associated protein CTR9
MTQFTQKAFKLDTDYPLTCANFGTYFLIRKTWTHVHKLAQKAIERSDVSAVASDGWYLLARMAHYQGETARAFEYYSRADQARGGDGRGGDDRGHIPAKFGMAQIKVLQDDFTDAKFRLERIQKLKSTPETMTLLGTLHAEEYFSVSPVPSKDDDKTDVWKKAVALLDAVRQSWKDPKKKVIPDPAILLNLARLYESDAPAKSLQCLQEVEQLELERMPEELRPQNTEDEEATQAALRNHLPPQLLNNIGCFHYQAERFAQARDNFQTALNACVRISQEDTSVDTDALLTTISFNLARTYEEEKMMDEAKGIYEGLLERHSDYLDASARLAYISLQQDPTGEGPKALSRVYHSAEQNLEIRALYGYYLNKSKKKTQIVAEDQEQRHLKRTLANFNNHDLYSLTADGNLHLAIARELPRSTEGEKEKRRKMYERAVEFFAKALQLDPKNAYAAQGIAIAVVEDKKDLTNGIQIFSKVRETMKDASVSINLGHAFCELKQYSRAIENVS